MLIAIIVGWHKTCLNSITIIASIENMMALNDLTILDLTHMVSGPYGAMLLADLGAQVIKVEPPTIGEGTRRLLENDSTYSKDGMGAYFLTLNRNKKSICIDLKSDEGKVVFRELVRKADIVIDNFSVGVTARLGIDYLQLKKVNPRIITCSITGFGSTGPDIHRPAFDQVVQAMGGGMSITGDEHTGHIRSGIPIGDLGGGIFGALGILAALMAREKTGVGQHVDISMLDVQISLLSYMGTMSLMSNEAPKGIGNGHFIHVPYNCYKTQDGYIVIACIGDSFFEKFAEFIKIPELQNPEYRSQPVRFKDKALIDKLISEELLKNTTEYWLTNLTKVRIPCGPVNNMIQALEDIQVNSRNMVVNIELDSGEMIRMPGNPIKLTSTVTEIFSPPPKIGQNTSEVLRNLLDYSQVHIDELAKNGIIQ